MRRDPNLICRRCHGLYADHVFERNRRRCADGQAFKDWIWTAEEIEAINKRAEELYHRFGVKL